MATSFDVRTSRKTGYEDRLWIPRFWNGMNARAWFPLLVRNRFAVAPRRVAMAAIISALTLVNFFWWAVQAILFGRRIARTEIKQDPIFVIGHWRSGTTLLHELLALDPRHTYPDTYDCFAPNHFLASGWINRPLLGLLLPSRRPMDNMAAGWDRPQEDEFALCNLGVPSPYLSLIFPNHPPQYGEYFELADISPRELGRWKETLLWFLKCVTLRHPKRIVLKSPPHTFRVKVLAEMFPSARFVHIVRDPSAVFPSTVKLWKRLSRDQGVQVPHYEGLQQYVFETFEQMYEVFERDRESVDASRICDIRYEDLIEDPIGQMQAVYEQLDLGQFDGVRPALQQYVSAKKGYKANRHEISPEISEEIGRRWATYIAKYGY